MKRTLLYLCLAIFFAGIIYLINFNLNRSEVVYKKIDSEVLTPNSKNYLYKINQNNKTFFLATDKKINNPDIDNTLISEDKFWSPANCAGMLTAIVHDNLYFFDTQFKGSETNEFIDVIYKYNIPTNTLTTYKSQMHKNIYSVAYLENKINIFYQEPDERFFQTTLKEENNQMSFADKKEIVEKEIYYPERIEVTGISKDTTYFLIQ